MEKLFTALIASIAIVTLFTVWGFWRTGQIPVYPRISGIALVKVERLDGHDLVKRSDDVMANHRRKILDSNIRPVSSKSADADKSGKKTREHSKPKKDKKAESFSQNAVWKKIDKKQKWESAKRMESIDRKREKYYDRNVLGSIDIRVSNNGRVLNLKNGKNVLNNSTNVLRNGKNVPKNSTNVLRNGKNVPKNSTNVVSIGEKTSNNSYSDGVKDLSTKQTSSDISKKRANVRRLQETLYYNAGNKRHLERVSLTDLLEGGQTSKEIIRQGNDLSLQSRLKKHEWAKGSTPTSALQQNEPKGKLKKKSLSSPVTKPNNIAEFYVKKESYVTSATPSSIERSTLHSVSHASRNRNLTSNLLTSIHRPSTSRTKSTINSNRLTKAVVARISTNSVNADVTEASDV